MEKKSLLVWASANMGSNFTKEGAIALSGTHYCYVELKQRLLVQSKEYLQADLPPVVRGIASHAEL